MFSLDPDTRQQAVIHDAARASAERQRREAIDDFWRDADAVLAASPGAVVYAASGDIRPDDAVADITRALAAGAVVVKPIPAWSIQAGVPAAAIKSRRAAE